MIESKHVVHACGSHGNEYFMAHEGLANKHGKHKVRMLVEDGSLAAERDIKELRTCRGMNDLDTPTVEREVADT